MHSRPQAGMFQPGIHTRGIVVSQRESSQGRAGEPARAAGWRRASIASVPPWAGRSTRCGTEGRLPSRPRREGVNGEDAVVERGGDGPKFGVVREELQRGFPGAAWRRRGSPRRSLVGSIPGRGGAAAGAPPRAPAGVDPGGIGPGPVRCPRRKRPPRTMPRRRPGLRRRPGPSVRSRSASSVVNSPRPPTPASAPPLRRTRRSTAFERPSGSRSEGAAALLQAADPRRDPRRVVHSSRRCDRRMGHTAAQPNQGVDVA